MVKLIQDYPDLVKDEYNGAILNTNNNALEAYKKQKKAMAKIGDLEKQVSDLSKQINQIESLLVQIYERVADK